ncbi:hypothetical protein BH09BAC1_BH09BAC1_27770 [soil metagenome]
MARFLLDTDYSTLIKDNVLMQVIEQNLSLLAVCENMAQQEVESYLRERYDMAHTFSRTGTDRNPLIVMYLIDVTLYHLHSRIATMEMNETRSNRYLAAKDWLERASEGGVTLDLQHLSDGTTGESVEQSRFNSNPRFNNDW